MCPCVLTTAFLAFIGCPHAASMHKANAALAPEWTGRDWRLHIDEEEEHLFPMMPEKLRLELLGHHLVFLFELHMFGRIISIALMRKHSKMEDDFIQAYLNANPALKAQLQPA